MKSEKLKFIAVDDFGLNDRANGLIMNALTVGAADLASTMVNMPGSQSALAHIRRTPHERPFGLHLNLTEGRPLSDPRAVASLVNGKGRFLGWPKLIRKSAVGQVRREDVLRETRAQIELFKESAAKIPFFNSHHHIHLWPPLAKIILPLCREYAVERVRIPQKIWLPPISCPYGFKALAIQFFGKLIINYQFSTSHYFIDLDWAGQSPKARRRWLETLPDDVELACHPFAADDPSNYKDSTVNFLTTNLSLSARSPKKSSKPLG